MKVKVEKADSDMSGKAVQGFIFSGDHIYPSCPLPSFLNMGLETVTLEFQRQARIAIISGSFLIIVLIQMNLFRGAKNYWEHIFMSISVIIYEHQKWIEWVWREIKWQQERQPRDSVVAILVLIFCLVAYYFCWLGCCSSVKCDVKWKAWPPVVTE